ncbi:MAG: translocation/assembly module TamB domain-containing protein [Rhodoferax sp.]|uniref:translocation/assembly module TamB domain-containing protein n=1 Tax=Rhodoferax sp. TaxID=50421 RepID=UPI002724000F|nr:translocation/assembly module TamB domain-containing protein [Rhodoferax sp.]MDO8449305.1 translocation/assembly module TamB domain-containing protein [Rhodoferax sp.]
MRPRTIFNWLIGVLAALALAVAALLIALWVWTGNDTSLATALQQASRYLPAGQVLVAEDVRGTLRKGGHIGMLRWEKDGWVVEAHQIELDWQPRALLDRRLQLDTLRIAQLSVEKTGSTTGSAPLDNLMLPFQVDLTFAVDALRWAGPPAAQATGLSGRYQFEGTRHVLRLDAAQLATGQYQAQASLLARAPMTLDAQLQGNVQAPVPGSTQPLPLAATASVQGNLAGPQALLELQAMVRPAVPAKPALAPRIAARAAPPMQATLAARINPWAAQPIARGDATFSSLNLAALWPQAPQTLLTGSAEIQPDAAPQTARTNAAWQAQGSLTNGLTGPWNLDRLPVANAQARVSFSAGQWRVQSLTADVGGGRVAVQGGLTANRAGAAQTAAISGWQGHATLQNINPAALHTQLAAARIDGKLNASTVQQAIEFDIQLQPSAKQPDASRLRGLSLKNASAKGRWVDGTLSVQTLQVQTSDALLQGQMEVQLPSKASQGQLQLTLPGGQAQIHGHMSARAGSGELSLHVTDAAKASRWLGTLPGASGLLGGKVIQGNGDLAGTWAGGWQSPDLIVRSSLSALVVQQVDAQPQPGTRRFTLQAQATGGRGSGSTWQAVISSVRLQALSSLEPGTWAIQNRQAITVNWKSTPTGSVLETTAGEADLTGPVPGSATLTWRPIRWSRLGARHELKTQGQLLGVPMGWLEMLGSAQVANRGLRGDLIFDGDWDVLAANTLKATASLVRRSGDISVQTEGEAGTSVSAGVRDARLTLKADGDALRASLRWDSERAGLAQGEFSTRISSGAEGWRWPVDAPLTGSLRAQLPQLGVWSVLAPPGWRIRGTLDANIALAGTRAAPQWGGTLNADGLALRSIADGIEFSNGRLRTTLAGQRLDIREFSLQGATGGGGSGGVLSAKGFAQWLPAGTVATSGLSRIHIELDAQAQALRVTARADRRLAVSGNLQAKLLDARLEIRGALKADQALFILPDENAPSLGHDVVVKSSAGKPAPTPSQSATTSPASKSIRIVPDVAITLDMGPDFQVQGRGLATRLAGTLNLVSSATTSSGPRLTGTVSTVRGTYKAYGQQLDIEEGVLRFTGPYDNPALDILAIRPNLTVRVGVQISGTALSPRVRLYAEPDLPEAEKLAWLVLGRSAANGGAEAAVLQQAAMALLGGNGRGLSGGLSQALGLDELSLRGSASNADGTTTGAAVTLGKRLSRDFYVAYERSMAGTLGTVYIFYELSRRFTLRAQTGEQSSIDLIFTVPYD